MNMDSNLGVNHLFLHSASLVKRHSFPHKLWPPRHSGQANDIFGLPAALVGCLSQGSTDGEAKMFFAC